MKLSTLKPENTSQFKQDMQQAFQLGANLPVKNFQSLVLPIADIEKSLNTKGAVAYQAEIYGKIVGGAIVVINKKTNCNYLDFLYVKNGYQSKGVGFKIWQQIEKLYPNTKIWETCTPYFEKRNINFYVNKCGFKVVEFLNKHHKSKNIKYFKLADSDEMFVLKKHMTPKNK